MRESRYNYLTIYKIGKALDPKYGIQAEIMPFAKKVLENFVSQQDMKSAADLALLIAADIGSAEAIKFWTDIVKSGLKNGDEWAGYNLSSAIYNYRPQNALGAAVRELAGLAGEPTKIEAATRLTF